MELLTSLYKASDVPVIGSKTDVKHLVFRVFKSKWIRRKDLTLLHVVLLSKHDINNKSFKQKKVRDFRALMLKAKKSNDWMLFKRFL